MPGGTAAALLAAEGRKCPAAYLELCRSPRAPSSLRGRVEAGDAELPFLRKCLAYEKDGQSSGQGNESGGVECVTSCSVAMDTQNSVDHGFLP